MKTTLFVPNACLRLLRRASLAATILAASAFVFVQPIFAQANVGSDPENPLPWGSVTVVNPPGPFGVLGNSPSSNSSALAPAPIQPQPESQISIPQGPSSSTSTADNPPPWGSTAVASPDNYGDVNPYSFSNAGAYTTPSYGGAAISPAPEGPIQPVEPGSPQGFVPPAPVGLVESFGSPPINPSFPELPPSVFARPAGTFQNPIR